MKRMEAVLDAIGDPHRHTLLDALRTGPATVTELAALVPIARPGVSRHLRILREVGLVTARSDAQRRIYELQPDALGQLDDWLAPYRNLWMQRMHALHIEIARGRRNGDTAP